MKIRILRMSRVIRLLCVFLKYWKNIIDGRIIMIVEEPMAPVIPKTVPRFFAMMATIVSTTTIMMVMSAIIQYSRTQIISTGILFSLTPIRSRIINRRGWDYWLFIMDVSTNRGMLKHMLITIATRQIMIEMSSTGNESNTLLVYVLLDSWIHTMYPQNE